MNEGGQTQADDQVNGQNNRDFDYNQLDEAVGKLMEANKEDQSDHREDLPEVEDRLDGRDTREDEPSMEEHHLPKPRGFALDVMHPKQRSMRTKDYNHQLDEPEITAGSEYLLVASDEDSARPAPYQDIMVARREASSTSREVAEIDSQIKANSSSDDGSDAMQFEYSDYHDKHESAPGERAIYSDDNDEDDDNDYSDDSEENYDADFDDEVEADDASADETTSDYIENENKVESGVESRFESETEAESDEAQTESDHESWSSYQTEGATNSWGYHDQASPAFGESKEDSSTEASGQELTEDQSVRASTELVGGTLDVISESVGLDQAESEPSLGDETEPYDQPELVAAHTDSTTELKSDTYSTNPSYRRNYLSGALPANNLVKPKTEIDDRPSKGLFDTSEYHTAIKQPIKQPKNNCKKIVWSLAALDVITILIFAYYVIFR